MTDPGPAQAMYRVLQRQIPVIEQEMLKNDPTASLKGLPKSRIRTSIKTKVISFGR